LQISTKSTAQFLSNSCLKNRTQKQKFTHARSRTCHSLSNYSVNDVLVEATPLLDEMLFQVVDIANPAMVDAVAGPRPTPHSPRD